MSNSYVDYILDLLSPFGSITSKAMFGGYGVYKEKIIVGIIVDDELYFKVDATNKAQYEALNSMPFTYTAKAKKINLSYWKVPIEIMENEEQLSIWLEQSFFISINKTKHK